MKEGATYACRCQLRTPMLTVHIRFVYPARTRCVSIFNIKALDWPSQKANQLAKAAYVCIFHGKLMEIIWVHLK